MSAWNDAPQGARDVVRRLMQLGAVDVHGLSSIQWAVLRELVKQGVPAQLDGRDLWVFEWETHATRVARLTGLHTPVVWAALAELQDAGWISRVKVGKRGLELFTVELVKVGELLDSAQRRDPPERDLVEDDEPTRRCPYRCGAGGPDDPGEEPCPICGGTGDAPESCFCHCSESGFTTEDHGVSVCDDCGGVI